MSENPIGEESALPSQGRSKRIVIVDDHPLVREGLVSLIWATEDLSVFGQAGGADELWQILDKGLPDLVLLDLSLPGISGADLLKELILRFPQLRVLVVSMHEEGVYAERLLRAGAYGYIMKQEPGAKIIEAIRCVLRGDIYTSSEVSAQLVRQYVDGRAGDDNEGIGALSNRELQIYTYLGNGLTSQEIAGRLGLSVKTVHAHREHIKRKLGIRNAASLVYAATHWAQSSSTLALP